MGLKDIIINIGAKDTASTALRRVSKNLKSFGRSITGMGVKFAAFGTAAGAGVGFAVKTFASFDDAMARVGAVSGATGNSLAELREKAKQLGASTSFSAAEAAQGMQMLGQAGFNTEQILAGIGPTLALAAAGAVELSEAADIASDIAGAFGLSADEIGRVSDVIAQTATSANTDVLMMGGTFSKVAPIARAAGQSLEETAAAAGLLGNNGVKATVAGTDLKAILASLSLPATQKAFDDLGVSVLDSNKEMRPFLDVMREYGEATANMTGPDKVSKAMALFGKLSAKSALILADAGDQVDYMRGRMAEADGAAQRMAETMLSGLGGSFTKIMSAAEGVQIALVETFSVTLQSATAFIQSFLSQLTAWIQANPALAQSVVAASLAIGAFGFSLIAIGTSATLAGLAISGITAAVGMLLTPLGAAAAAVAIVGAGLLAAAVRGGVFRDLVGTLAPVASQAFGGIADAIAAANWPLAMEIAWEGVKVAFFSGINAIAFSLGKAMVSMWEMVKSFFMRFLFAAGKAAEKVAEQLRNPFRKEPISWDFLDFESGMTGPGDWIVEQAQAARDNLDRLTKQASGASKKIAESSTPAAGDIASMVKAAQAEVNAALGGAAPASQGTSAESTGGGMFSGIAAGALGAMIGMARAGQASLQPIEQRDLQATQSRLLTTGGEDPVVAKANAERRKQLAASNKLLAKMEAWQRALLEETKNKTTTELVPVES